MKHRRTFLRVTALVMAAVLTGSLLWMGCGLERQEPDGLPQQKIQKILPESPQADKDRPGDEDGSHSSDHHKDDKDEENPPPEQNEENTPQPPTEEETPTEQEDSPESQTQKPDPDHPEGDPNHPGSGETDENGQGEDIPTEGGEDDSQLRIVTDLSNCTITYDQLENDTLPFYAYIINGDRMKLKVKLQNSTTPQNGRYLTGDGKDYTAQLARGEVNRFTLYVKDGSATVHEVTYRVRYMAQRADEEHPTIGEHPPTIHSNLEGVRELSNRNFTMTLTARDYHGKSLYASSIEVRQDGHILSHPTGRNPYEYELHFPNPTSGNTSHHRITVTAWDAEGNSAFVAYDILYRFVDTGQVIGSATIILDATTVGLDIPDDPYTYKIKQGEPASYAVLAMLQDCGYEVKYSGSLDTGFYVQRISRAGMMDFAQIPDTLWAKIQQDGLNLTNQYDNDSLGEFDYTQGSGWVYSIGGETYAGKGLSNYYLSDGDTLYLRFTLAYGKDLGGAVDEEAPYGTLSSYCGKWINGTYIPQHSWSKKEYTQDPTCTEDGCVYHKCTVCGEKDILQTLPATGHHWKETDRQEPADGADGWIHKRCTQCGQEKEEVIPWTGENEKEEKKELPVEDSIG